MDKIKNTILRTNSMFSQNVKEPNPNPICSEVGIPASELFAKLKSKFERK